MYKYVRITAGELGLQGLQNTLVRLNLKATDKQLQLLSLQCFESGLFVCLVRQCINERRKEPFELFGVFTDDFEENVVAARHNLTADSGQCGQISKLAHALIDHVLPHHRKQGALRRFWEFAVSRLETAPGNYLLLTVRILLVENGHRLI